MLGQSCSVKTLFSKKGFLGMGLLWAAQQNVMPSEKRFQEEKVREMLDAKSLVVAKDRHLWGHRGTGLAIAFSQVPTAPSAWWLVQKRFISETEAGGQSPYTAKANQ